MSDPTLQRVLDKAVLGLFGPESYASTFLTTIYCSLKVSWKDDIPTACTNGVYLWINPAWFQTLSEKMRVTLLAHELWHIAYMHMARCGWRIHEIFNMAADHAINLMLIAHGYHFDRLPNGEMLGLADPQYIGMTAEQIYDKLIKNTFKIELPFGSDFSTPESPDEMEEPTPEQQADIVALITKATILSQMNPSEAGTLPAEFTSMMDTLLRPRLKWENLVDRWLTERSDEGHTWTKPNRRFRDVYLPSRTGQEGLVHLVYAIDCSGSLKDSQLLVINSELKGWKERFNPQAMTIISFDTRIQKSWELTNEDDLSSLKFIGRGGTDMHPVFALVEAQKPQALIMMSDMDCVIPPKPKATEILWVCLDNPRWLAPYGKAIHIDTKRDL